MSLSQKEIRTIESDLIPWTEREPEPEGELETAEEYAGFAKANFAESDRAFAKELSERIPKGAIAVDIGCGPALQDIELAKLSPKIAHIFALDLDPEMIEVSKAEAQKAGVLNMFTFQKADMTKLIHLDIPTNSFVFSNTAIHELRTTPQLTETFGEIANLVGENGGCMIRDLLRPANERQAEEWREEVLKGEILPQRGLKLFRNSQRAGFSLSEVQTAIESTSLQGRGQLVHLSAPRSRYWVYEIKPQSNLLPQIL